MTAAKPAHIVFIGGGTGLFTALSGLKLLYPEVQLSAIVTMMDSGGSTGRLRDEFGYLPPGDVRKCLVALSDAPQELRELVQYRFKGNGSLAGHSVGNILLTALKDIAGGEYEAIVAMEQLLNIRGHVYPVTLTNSNLVATLSDGTIVKGETNIYTPKYDASLSIVGLRIEPKATLFEKARQALLSATAIVIGPGALHPSILPNLLVEGMVETLKEAKRRGAKIIYITNTMTKYRETTDYTATMFIKKVQDALDGASIDVVIVNTGKPPEELLAAYEKERATVVKNDIPANAPYRVITGDIISKETFARHSKKQLAKAIGRAALERA